MKHWSDIDLFVAIKEGDTDALAVLFLRYNDYLKHYGWQIVQDASLVDECIQDLFVYIFESYERLSEVKYVKAYLFRSLRRRVIEKIQREQRQKKSDREFADLTDFQFSGESLLLEEEVQQDTRNALIDALNHLPWRQREAIYLRYYNSLKTKEIAEIMGVANQTILNTLHQALKKIKQDKHLSKLLGLTASWLLVLMEA
jgi:RNA polymerase sigma factor (sigma-70 family)